MEIFRVIFVSGFLIHCQNIVPASGQSIFSKINVDVKTHFLTGPLGREMLKNPSSLVKRIKLKIKTKVKIHHGMGGLKGRGLDEYVPSPAPPASEKLWAPRNNGRPATESLGAARQGSPYAPFGSPFGFSSLPGFSGPYASSPYFGRSLKANPKEGRKKSAVEQRSGGFINNAKPYILPPNFEAGIRKPSSMWWLPPHPILTPWFGALIYRPIRYFPKWLPAPFASPPFQPVFPPKFPSLSG